LNQRLAMKKLDFLVGVWKGEARLARGSGESIELVQTEEAGFKLGGLILVIEGTGRAKSDGVAVLQAFGVLSYDDDSQTYRMCAFNDGRFLETEINRP
jgi:hypothetical protein